jgi:hypothetical protein
MGRRIGEGVLSAWISLSWLCPFYLKLKEVMTL